MVSSNFPPCQCMCQCGVCLVFTSLRRPLSTLLFHNSLFVSHMELFLFGSLACCLSFHNPLAVLAILLRLSLCALQQFPAIQQDVSLQSSHYLIPDTEACLPNFCVPETNVLHKSVHCRRWNYYRSNPCHHRYLHHFLPPRNDRRAVREEEMKMGTKDRDRKRQRHNAGLEKPLQNCDRDYDNSKTH